MTLIEMLVSVSIVGISAAGIAGLLLLNNLSTLRTFNKVDNLRAARQAIERIGKDLRMARNIGDVYGEPIKLQSSPVVVWGTWGSDEFPSANNPVYNAGQSPPPEWGGWPVAPWPSKPYKLSATTLIVQIPVFTPSAAPSYGFPSRIVTDEYGEGNPASTQDNVDTVVYQILPDPDWQSDPDDPFDMQEYIMQVAGFPGKPIYDNTTDPPTLMNVKVRANPPVTLVKGIVGPLDPVSGQPKVFQFLNKYDPTGNPSSTIIPGTQLGEYTGVVVNLEIKSTQEGKLAKAIVGFKSEVFMRNNTLSQVNNP